jgi:Ca2+/H+ antiporter
MPKSAWAFPAVSVLFFGVATLVGFGSSFNATPLDFAFAAALLVVLFGTVFAAVYHAEVIAHRTGEPYGTLVLTIAVTVIELALIASIMLGDKPNPALARDTVFAVVMIICNGLVGMCILAGGLRYREQGFRGVRHPKPCAAELRALGTGPRLHDEPTRFRQRGHVRALWRVSVHADGAPSRLLHREGRVR